MGRGADSTLRHCRVQDGLYLMQEGMTDTYTKWNWEHPALVGAYGMLPGDGVDPAIMRATVRKADGSLAVGPHVGLGFWDDGHGGGAGG